MSHEPLDPVSLATHLNPLAAKVLDTLARTPGSFWTSAFKVCLTKGSSLGGGVLYRMLLTASWADQLRGARLGWFMVGKECPWCGCESL